MFLLYLMTAAAHAVFTQRFRYRAEVDFLIVIIAANFLAELFVQDRSTDRTSSTAGSNLANAAGRSR